MNRRWCGVLLLAIPVLGGAPGCDDGFLPRAAGPATVEDALHEYEAAVAARSLPRFTALHEPGVEFVERDPAECPPWLNSAPCLPWLDAAYWDAESAGDPCTDADVTLEFTVLTEERQSTAVVVGTRLRILYTAGGGSGLAETRVGLQLVEEAGRLRIGAIRDVGDPGCE